MIFKQRYFDNKKSREIIIPVALLLFNIAIKSIHLGSQPIANDEPFTIFHAQLALPHLFSELSRYNNPPGFEFLLHFWIKIFGIGPLSVRFLPMLFSSLSAVVLYQIGRKNFSFQTGLLAALFFTFSSFNMYFAHEARVYSLFTLLSLLSMYFFIEITRHERISQNSTYYILSTAALFYAHFFGFWIILVQFFSVLLIKQLRTDFFRIYIWLFLIPLLLYVPYTDILLERFLQSTSEGTWVRPPKGLISLFDILRNFFNEPYGDTLFIKPVVTVLALGAMLLGFVQYLRVHRLKAPGNHTSILLIWFLLPLISIFLLSYFTPMLVDRYMVFIGPAIYLLLALSLTPITPITPFTPFTPVTPFTPFTPLTLLTLFLLTLQPNPSNHRNIPAVVSKIQELKQRPNTIIFICPPWFDLNLAYYQYPGQFRQANGIRATEQLKSQLQKDDIYPIYSYTEIDTSKLLQYQNIIFVDAGADFSLPGNGVYNVLRRHNTLAGKTDIPGIFRIYLFK